MFQVIERDLAEKNEASMFKVDSALKSDIAKIRNSSSDLSNTETVSCSSANLANGSSENLFEELMPNPTAVEPAANVTSVAKSKSLEIVKGSSKPLIEVEELMESINSQMEETEEMLDMISRAKGKLEFFLSHVEHLVKSLQDMLKHSAVSSISRNTYLKRIYRKKLEEFASGLIGKIQKSIEDLQVDCETLKEQEKKTAGFFEKITEFNRISDEIDDIRVLKLKETIDDLIEEMFLLKPKQLSEIEKVSYIETDIEMLYDLIRRFSSIEGHNLISF